MSIGSVNMPSSISNDTKMEEYKVWLFNLPETPNLPGTSMEKMNINGKIYVISVDAVSHTNPNYVKNAIINGQKLLNEINISTNLANSPIKSRQDMANLIWALYAEAWQIDPNQHKNSSSLFISYSKLYETLKNAKDKNGKLLSYSRGGKNDSSHLKPFPKSKCSQMGFDAYEKGQFATNKRNELLPYGKNTLLFAKLDRAETGFGKDRTFIKLEDHGIDGGLFSRNTIAHGLDFIKEILNNTSTKENDFRENTAAISKIVQECVRDSKQYVLTKSLSRGLAIASLKGLTALAKFISENKGASSMLQLLEQVISLKIEKNLLKGYQIKAIQEWKRIPHNQNQSTLAYFATHDQSGKEMVLDLS
ncbi:MAG: hypothetical protein LBS71_00505 [Puniceicoccales bacterium]|jgi:hypothetical protein|nr:hypothetical protein [Puniceicoccales bacterium]